MRIDAAAVLHEVEVPLPEEGRRLADAVLRGVEVGEVELDLTGVRGMTTAFANAFFLRMFASLTPDEVRAKVKLETRSALQRDVMRRSLQAALLDTASGQRPA
ncbi:MAG: STAS-like domain-containing protein [Alphaproteobacteria bacterium]|nr:STAS-like domain-containing protein [Alphaproteobacteria bacterium]